METLLTVLFSLVVASTADSSVASSAVPCANKTIIPSWVFFGYRWWREKTALVSRHFPLAHQFFFLLRIILIKDDIDPEAQILFCVSSLGVTICWTSEGRPEGLHGSRSIWDHVSFTNIHLTAVLELLNRNTIHFSFCEQVFFYKIDVYLSAR